MKTKSTRRPRLTPAMMARMFHEAYERIAPQFGYRTRRASAKPWPKVPAKNRRLMEAVCSEIMEKFPKFAGTALLLLFMLGGARAQTAHYRYHDGVALNDSTLSPGQAATTKEKDVCNQPAGWTAKFRNTSDALKAEVYAEYGIDVQKFKRDVFCFGAVRCDTDAEWAKKNSALVKGHKRKHSLPLYEVDHIDSLQLGGADVKANLMIQPYYAHPGAHEKDAVENWLHAQVCSGKVSLADAQHAIATDWYAAYLKMKAATQ